MASLCVVLVCLVLVVSRVSVATGQAFKEPLCSKYEFEERVLEKLVRIDHKVQLMDKQVGQFKTTLEKTLEGITEQRDGLDRRQNALVDNVKGAVSEAEANVSQTIEDVQKQVERMSEDIVGDRDKINETLKKFLHNTTAAVKQMRDDLVPLSVAFFARGVYTSKPSSGSVIRFTTTTVNVGGSYNSGTGYFTAPYDGVYQFTVQICARKDAYIHIQIVAAGSAISGLRQHDNVYSGVCTSGNAMTLLKTGDKVWVKCAGGIADSAHRFFIYEGGVRYTNSFSGVLIHRTKL